MRSRWTIAAILIAAAAGSCTKSPVSPAGTSTVTTPGLTSPANNEQIPNANQPVTLTVNNAFVSGGGGANVTYTFEVATESTFASKVQTKDVAQGATQTSAQLATLAPGTDYFWRVRTTGGDTVGVYSAPLRFRIGSAVTLQAPTPVLPDIGENVSPKSTFTVTNSNRSGPAGVITYRFEFATSAAFTSTVATATATEGNGQTSVTLSQALPEETTIFWRVQAIDAANNATSTFSVPRSVRTTVLINLATVDYQRFVNPSNWPETDRIIAVDQDGGDGYICINHTKRGLWPSAPFLGDPDATTEGTQWYFARINGKWYGGAGEWVRPNQICKDGQKSADIGPDGSWGGPMSTWVPKPGELVGYMMSTPARSWPLGRTLDERSDVVVLPWKVFGSTTATTASTTQKKGGQ